MSDIANKKPARLNSSKEFCYRLGGIARETLSRGVTKGTHPAADRTINGRKYWFDTTIDAYLEGDFPAAQAEVAGNRAAAQAEDAEAVDAEAEDEADGEEEESEAETPEAA